MTVAQEKEALTRILWSLGSQGWVPYQVRIDGEATHVGEMATPAVVDECAETWTATLTLRKGDLRGSLFLVWGNSPIELVADHSLGGGFEWAVDAALKEVFPYWPEEGPPAVEQPDLVQVPRELLEHLAAGPRLDPDCCVAYYREQLRELLAAEGDTP